MTPKTEDTAQPKPYKSHIQLELLLLELVLRVTIGSRQASSTESIFSPYWFFHDTHKPRIATLLPPIGNALQFKSQCEDEVSIVVRVLEIRNY